jgi:hypothetical protein
MAVRRIATTRRTDKGYAVLVETGKGTYALRAADLLTYDSESKVMAELSRQAALANDALGTIHIHQNRDGSLAIASGREPSIWPEDRPVSDVVWRNHG